MKLAYDLEVQKALRGVVRAVLQKVAAQGLEAPHHFYISLRTQYPGVIFPEHIIKAHPNDITIVLQHQFWDLKVNDQGFEVTLTFQEIPQKVYIPFDALLSFMDPSVRFGLHFTPPEPSTSKAEEKPEMMPNVKAASKPTTKTDTPITQKQPAKIIQLSQFRKK